MPELELKEVKFLSNHIPQMHAGEYQLTVQQKVSSRGEEMNDTPFEASQKFAVGGHRFSLHSTAIHTVFPPQGNLGEHSNILPHIVLKRSTLPWEWYGIKSTEIIAGEETQLQLSKAEEAIPWMAVLMLQEDRRWRGTFSKTDFQQKVSSDASLWTALLGHWFMATGDTDTFDLVPLEDRLPLANFTLSVILEKQINDYFSLHLVSGVEKTSGPFNKTTFQKEVNNQTELWDFLLKANWFYKTADEDIFVAASPTSRSSLASISPDDLGVASADLENTIQLVQQMSSKIDTFLDKHRGPKVVKVADLAYSKGGTPLSFPSYLSFPVLEQKIFEDPEEKVTIIDIEKNLLLKIMPKANEMTDLSHARQVMIKDKWGNISKEGEEKALVMGNRLPAPGADCTAFLLGLQDRLDKSSLLLIDLGDNSIVGTQLIRLIVLKKWSFSCINPKKNFIGLLRNVNGYTIISDNLGAPQAEDSQSFTLRLPIPVDPTSSTQSTPPYSHKYIAQGFVPLLHQLRDGRQIPGWFRGPLATGQHLQQLPLPRSAQGPLIRMADELMRFDSQLKMFDTSYAAAWELGRMLLLAQKDVAISLYQWKRRHKTAIRRAEQIAVYEHLPFQEKEDMSLEMPEDVIQWFDDLRLLKQLPFNYLVPKEEMLPTESIRFFQLDEQWMEALIDGAFSIGRVAYNDNVTYPNTFKPKIVSGFLLRSEVVSGWQDLEADAFAELPPSNNLDDEAGLLDNQLSQIRMERLSDNVLLVLFDGLLKTVDIHLQPEAIHFGFDQLEANATQYTKTLRALDGTEMEGTGHQFELAWRTGIESCYRVIDTSAIKANIDTALGQATTTLINSAEFAFYMIEGVPKVRFIRKDNSINFSQ